MLLCALIIVSTLSGCIGDNGFTRSVARSTADNSVSLVELDIRGVVHGKCSFVHEGEYIQLIYEEEGGELKARASNPTILDPIMKAKQCREEAANPPQSSDRLRTFLNEEKEHETPQEIEQRLSVLQGEIATNQEYIDQLRPRFVGLSLFNNNKKGGYVITLGNKNQRPTPEVGVSTPTQNFDRISLGFPMKMLGGVMGWK